MSVLYSPPRIPVNSTGFLWIPVDQSLSVHRNPPQSTRSSEDCAETFFADWTETFFGASLADACTAGFGAGKSSRDCADASTAGFGASHADARTAGFRAGKSSRDCADARTAGFGAGKSSRDCADASFGASRADARTAGFGACKSTGCLVA